MAALISRELQVDPELVEGSRGEFTVWVGDEKVAQKGWVRFPSDSRVLEAVREALAT